MESWDPLHCCFKVIHPKYSKHWPYTLANTIDCVCSKMLNYGLNHGLFLSLFKFFAWKYILNWINSGYKKVVCYIVSDLWILLEIQAILPETSLFLSAQLAVLSSFFQMFIVLGIICITLCCLRNEKKEWKKAMKSFAFVCFVCLHNAAVQVLKQR
jgi:putative flippase GtrA